MKLIFGLALFLQSAFCSAALIDKIAAVVNSDVILLSDIERFEKTIVLRKELDPLFGFSEGLDSGAISTQKALEFLVAEKLILQSFKTSDTDVEQEVQNVQRGNNLDREQLVSFLASKGFTFNEYFELMRTGLSKRTLLDREIRSRVNITEDDIRNYFVNNAIKTDSAPVEFSIQIIALHNKTYRTTKLAESAAQSALEAINRGESFHDVAKRVSDDASASAGGELGTFSGDQLAEPLKSAVKKLKIGQISGVLKTAEGFLIVKLLDAKSAETDKYKQMKEEIREKLAREEYKKQLVIWAERARNSAYVHVN